ncbi:hypothetical protein HHK36_003181 [Tetracentron sinense]|uniref:Uncharacterized protein n=1 Tax=Tetracentron sinense TaxID=13715 RepID=A0A834ZN99_TETSI|nr:hypothetical protein HHK36_003181 [Tetracentron sinense]
MGMAVSNRAASSIYGGEEWRSSDDLGSSNFCFPRVSFLDLSGLQRRTKLLSGLGLFHFAVVAAFSVFYLVIEFDIVIWIGFECWDLRLFLSSSASITLFLFIVLNLLRFCYDCSSFSCLYWNSNLNLQYVGGQRHFDRSSKEINGKEKQYTNMAGEEALSMVNAGIATVRSAVVHEASHLSMEFIEASDISEQIVAIKRLD